MTRSNKLRTWASLALCLLAFPAWFFTLNVPWLRASAAAAWLLLAVGVLLGWRSARGDRRRWVRAVLGVDVFLALAFAGLFFFATRLPTSTASSLERAPEFELESADGTRVKLSERLAQGPALLVFYRGPW